MSELIRGRLMIMTVDMSKVNLVEGRKLDVLVAEVLGLRPRRELTTIGEPKEWIWWVGDMGLSEMPYYSRRIASALGAVEELFPSATLSLIRHGGIWSVCIGSSTAVQHESAAVAICGALLQSAGRDV